MPPGYFRFGFAASGIAISQMLAPPVVSALSLLLSTQILGVNFSDYYMFLAITAGLLYYIFLRGQLSEDWGTFTSSWVLARRTALAWLAVIAALLLIGYATKVSAVYSRRALFTWFVLTPPLLAGSLMMLRQLFRQAVVRSGEARSAVIAGANESSLQLGRSIIERPELGLSLKGYFDDRKIERLGEVDPEQILGRLSELPDYARNNRVDTVFIAVPLTHIQRTKDLLDELRNTTVSLYFVPDVFVFDLIQAQTTDLNGIPVVALCETPFQGVRGLVKRASDLVLASLMLMLALPALLVIALAVKLTSPGSVIFRQRRYGLDGEEIVVYKFRTMTTSEDGNDVTQATRQDQRITPLGGLLRRYSLDELPQLFNVLQGRMSLIGPRPHAVAHNEQYRRLVDGYMVRHKVAPGITGLAQVNGCRGETANVNDMEKRIAYDLEYLRNWSLALDLKILIRTAMIWLKDEKAY